MVARQPFLAAVQARKALRWGSGGLAWKRSGASGAKRRVCNEADIEARNDQLVPAGIA